METSIPSCKHPITQPLSTSNLMFPHSLVTIRSRLLSWPSPKPAIKGFGWVTIAPYTTRDRGSFSDWIRTLFSFAYNICSDGPITWPNALERVSWSWPLTSRGQECVELYLHSPTMPSWRGAQLKKHRDTFPFLSFGSIEYWDGGFETRSRHQSVPTLFYVVFLYVEPLTLASPPVQAIPTYICLLSDAGYSLKSW
jgi:hypothetical protein